MVETLSRNQYVASVLNNQSGIVTLLVDLLSSEEQEIDEKTKSTDSTLSCFPYVLLQLQSGYFTIIV